MYIHVHDFVRFNRLYMHVHDFIHVYVHGTYTFMYVNRCMDMVQARLYSFTTILHFPFQPVQPCDTCESQLRSGASPSEQPPSCHQSFQLTDHPGTACHVQTATVRFYLIHIADTLAIGCCIVTAAHLEARPLVLAEQVRNGRA